MMKYVTRFHNFCCQTTLHGWCYLGDTRAYTRTFWLLVILGSVVAALVLLGYGFVDFQSGYVKVEIEDRAADLTDVYFPSVVVCNINTVRKSFMYFLNEIVATTWEDVSIGTLWGIILKEFLHGEKGNITEAEASILDSVMGSKGFAEMFEQFIRENKNATLNISNVDEVFIKHQINKLLAEYGPYQNQNETFKKVLHRNFFLELASQWEQGQMLVNIQWNGMDRLDKSNKTGLFNLRGFGTDYGICNWLTPYVWMPRAGEEFELNKLKSGVTCGENNGLILMLDAETYDYWSGQFDVGQRAGDGFKVALLHHLDMPTMHQIGVNIFPGSSVQIAVTPTLFNTTTAARTRFTPKERKCYYDDEIKLNNLPYPPQDIYRYEISNCLFEAAIQQITEQCNCYPSFHQFSPNMCHGDGMTCLNDVLFNLGSFREVNDGGEHKHCFAACEDLTFSSLVTSALYPSVETFNHRPEFCQLVIKISRTCKIPSRKKSLEKRYSGFCADIEEVMGGTACEGVHAVWNSRKAFGGNDTKVDAFEELLVKYTTENIAIINVFIREPYVQKIVLDERMSHVTYVSNVGGILGLCMGCSLVTGVEIIWHIFIACWNKKSISPGD